MAYFPILDAPGCEGFTVLHNFPPNNWEISSRGPKYVNATTISEEIWTSKTVGLLDHMESQSYTRLDVGVTEELCLLSLTDEPLPPISHDLPKLKRGTFVPEWRATLGLRRRHSVVSYQGEIEAFPTSASLLTFGPMIQRGKENENYILVLNIEKKPVSRNGLVRVFNATDLSSPVATFEIQNNKINVIPLEQDLLDTEQLTVIACEEIAGIPLYFSCHKVSSALSLEHTHPPGSMAIHGDRAGVQRLAKKYWYGKMNHE